MGKGTRECCLWLMAKHPLLPPPKCFLEGCVLSSGFMGPYVHQNSFTEAVSGVSLLTVSGSAQIRSPWSFPSKGSITYFSLQLTFPRPLQSSGPISATLSHPQSPAMRPALLISFPELTAFFCTPTNSTFCPLCLESPACFMTTSVHPSLLSIQRLLAAFPDPDLTT